MLALAIESVKNRWFSRGFRPSSSFLVQCYSEACLATIDRMLETLRAVEVEDEHRDAIMQSAHEIEAMIDGWSARVRRPAER